MSEPRFNTAHPDLIASAYMESPLAQIPPETEAELCALEDQAKREAIRDAGDWPSTDTGDEPC